MNAAQQFGAHIRRLRFERGWSQADLAREMNARGVGIIYPQTIAKIETGKREVKFAEGMALAAILDVSPADLLSGTSTHARPDRWADHEQRITRLEAMVALGNRVTPISRIQQATDGGVESC